jgi:hypothetical protein
MLLYPILLKAGRFIVALAIAILLYCLVAWLVQAVFGQTFLRKDTPAILFIVLVSLAIKDGWNARFPIV